MKAMQEETYWLCVLCVVCEQSGDTDDNLPFRRRPGRALSVGFGHQFCWLMLQDAQTLHCSFSLVPVENICLFAAIL